MQLLVKYSLIGLWSSFGGVVLVLTNCVFLAVQGTSSLSALWAALEQRYRNGHPLASLQTKIERFFRFKYEPESSANMPFPIALGVMTGYATLSYPISPNRRANLCFQANFPLQCRIWQDLHWRSPRLLCLAASLLLVRSKPDMQILKLEISGICTAEQLHLQIYVLSYCLFFC